MIPVNTLGQGQRRPKSRDKDFPLRNRLNQETRPLCSLYGTCEINRLIQETRPL